MKGKDGFSCPMLELTLIPMKLHSESMPSLRVWLAPSKTPASHGALCCSAAAWSSANGLA